MRLVGLPVIEQRAQRLLGGVQLTKLGFGFAGSHRRLQAGLHHPAKQFPDGARVARGAALHQRCCDMTAGLDEQGPSLPIRRDFIGDEATWATIGRPRQGGPGLGQTGARLAHTWEDPESPERTQKFEDAGWRRWDAKELLLCLTPYAQAGAVG